MITERRSIPGIRLTSSGSPLRVVHCNRHASNRGCPECLDVFRPHRTSTELFPLTMEALGHCYCYSLTDPSPEDIAAHTGDLPVKCGELRGPFGHSFSLPYGWGRGSHQSTKSPEVVRELA